MERNIEKILEVLTRYSRIDGPAISAGGQTRLERALKDEDLIEFGIFCCPPINARLLLTDQPEEYIQTSPIPNPLEKSAQINRLDKLFIDLGKINISTRLRIIVGDTDEEDYIFPVIEPPTNIDSSVCDKRRAIFVDNFTQWIQKNFFWPVTVDRYSEIAALFDDDLPRLDFDSLEIQKDLSLENIRMREIFGPDNYYTGLPMPNDNQLKKIVELKFQTYGRQGIRLTEFYPDMILIQNEFPLLLRTRMLNLLTCQLGREQLPAFYPFSERI